MRKEPYRERPLETRVNDFFECPFSMSHLVHSGWSSFAEISIAMNMISRSTESSLERSLCMWKFKHKKWAVLSLVNPSFVTGVLGVTPVVMPMPLWPGLQCYDAKMCLLLWIFRSYFFWKLESTSYGSPVCNPSTQEVGQKGYKFEAIQGWRTKLCLTERNQFPQISRYLDFCLSVLV